jgi:hypothetical protein
MKFYRIYALIIIFLIFNVHLVELSEKTRRHRSRFHIANKNESNSNSKISNSIQVSQFAPIESLKSRISNIYSSVSDSNVFKYTLGGILFLLEIFVKLPDSDNQILKFLKDQASMILSYEQFSKNCYDGFKYFYDLLTKKDEEDRKFTENLINVSKETKTYLLDTYMYFTNYKTINTIITKENYDICMELKGKIKTNSVIMTSSTEMYINSGILSKIWHSINYKCNINNKYPECEPSKEFFDKLLTETTAFLKENENNNDLATFTCEREFSVLHKYICLVFFDIPYFSLDKNEKSNLSKKAINLLKAKKPEEIAKDSIEEFKSRDKFIREFDCNILPKKYDAEKESYVSKFLKFFEKITEAIKKGLELYQTCLLPSYEYVKSKYDESIERIEEEKKKIEMEELNKIVQLFNGNPQEFTQGINRMVELSKAGIIRVTQEQILKILEHTQNMESLKKDEIINKTLDSLNSANLDTLIDSSVIKSENEFNELIVEMKQEKKPSRKEEEMTAIQLYLAGVLTFDQYQEKVYKSLPAEVVLYANSVNKVKVIEDIKLSPDEFICKTPTYVNNQIGSDIETQVKTELKTMAGVVIKEAKSMGKEKVDQYKKDKSKLIKDAAIVGIAIAASVATAPIMGPSVALAIGSKAAKHGTKILAKRSLYEYLKLKTEQSFQSRGMSENLKKEHPIVYQFALALYQTGDKNLKKIVTDPKGMQHGMTEFASKGLMTQAKNIGFGTAEKVFDNVVKDNTKELDPIVKYSIDNNIKELKDAIKKKLKISSLRFYRFKSRSHKLKLKRNKSKNVELLKILVENSIVNSAIDIYNEQIMNKILPVLSRSKNSERITQSLVNVKDIIMNMFGDQIVKKVKQMLIETFGGIGLLKNIMRFKEVFDIGVTIKNAIYSDDIVEKFRLMGRAIGSIIDFVLGNPNHDWVKIAVKQTVENVCSIKGLAIMGAGCLLALGAYGFSRNKRFRKVLRRIKKFKRRRI